MQNDHPNATAYLQHIHKNIVVIAARFADDACPPKPCGTGCLIGYSKRPSGELLALISTAAHVVDHDPRDRIEWTIVRPRSDGHRERAAVFVTPSETASGNVRWYQGKWYRGKHNRSSNPQLDIAAIEFRNDLTEGGFFEPTEKFPRVLHTKVGLTAGTRVAWAGYGSIAQTLLGRPFLQYYEGVVSAHVDVPDHPPLYLIDGHNDPGLSGSPVWWWNDESGEAEIAAVITHYASMGESGMQGMVLASPINPLMEHLKGNRPTAQSSASETGV